MSTNTTSVINNRELIFDFLRSILMITVFNFHFYKSFPGNTDYAVYINPFAELFVGLAGFMVGLIYLYRNKDLYLIKRGFKILFAFYIIALPEAAIKTYAIDNSPDHIVNTILNVILMQEDPTSINILRFYGLIFIFLPIILYFYRRLPVQTIIISVCTFFISTLIYNYSGNAETHSFFVSQTVMLLLQWQLFLVIGLKIGDLYKTKKIDLSKIKKILVIAGVLAILAQLLWFRHDIIKFPYSFGKLLGTIYLAPIVLYIIIYIYSKVKGSYLDTFVRVVGRNSLIAFVLSELIRITLIKVPISLFTINYTELSSFVFSLFLSIILICIMWIYEKIKSLKKEALTKNVGIKKSKSKKNLSVN